MAPTRKNNVFQNAGSNVKNLQDIIEGLQIDVQRNNQLLETQIKMKRIEIALQRLIEYEPKTVSAYYQRGSFRKCQNTKDSSCYEYVIHFNKNYSIQTLLKSILLSFVQDRGYEFPEDASIGFSPPKFIVNEYEIGKELQRLDKCKLKLRDEILNQIEEITGYDATLIYHDGGKFSIVLP